LKTLSGLRILCELIGKELQRDITPKPHILGLVDDTHSSTAKFFNNSVMRSRFADHVCARQLTTRSVN
jgi:hypothetical protein